MRCYRCAKTGHGAKSCKKTCAHCLEPHHDFICQKMYDAASVPPINSGGGGKKKKADVLLTVCSRPFISNLVLQTFWVKTKGIEKHNIGVFGGDVEEKLMAKSDIILKQKMVKSLFLFYSCT